ncbi:MAG: sigma-70 family RNA polymerase sigma factor [Cyanophyceae cyanobacterium]
METFSHSDEALFKLLEKGDQTALANLYDRYGRMVYGLSLKMLKNPQEAEDLTQEIFLSLWTNAERNTNIRRCISYLATLTRSRAIDKIRKRGTQLNLLERWGRAESIYETERPLEQAMTQEQATHVQQALNYLSQVQRQVIELAYNQGMSQSEIAQFLGIPLGTVKSHTRLGLIKLRQVLTLHFL